MTGLRFDQFGEGPMDPGSVTLRVDWMCLAIPRPDSGPKPELTFCKIQKIPKALLLASSHLRSGLTIPGEVSGWAVHKTGRKGRAGNPGNNKLSEVDMFSASQKSRQGNFSMSGIGCRKRRFANDQAYR